MDMKLNIIPFGKQKSFQLGSVIQMDLGDIIEVSEVSQNAQKCPRRLRMASTGREREKIQSSKNLIKTE
jgi:hypothetical protein